jgi:hypothetical protein
MSTERAELVFATTAEYAAHRGCSDSLVRRWKRTGKIVVDEQRSASGDDRHIIVAASDAKLGRVLDRSRGGDRTGKHEGAATPPVPEEASSPATRVTGSSDSFNIANTRERLAKAKIAELDLAERVGTLVKTEDVEVRVFNMARAGREAIMALPDRMSVTLAAESDPHKVHALLTDACRKVCELMAAGTQLAVDLSSEAAA